MIDPDQRLAGSSSQQETTLWNSVKRFWPIVLGCTLLFIVLGLFVASRQEAAYEATAGVIIEDPRAQDPFAITNGGALTNQASERYLADQVEIIRSIVVATAAVENLDWETTPGALIQSTTVEGRLVSNLVEVTARQPTPEQARDAANAVVQAYIDVQQASAREVAAAAVESVGALIESTDVRLIRVREDINALVGATSDERAELLAQLALAEAELNQARRDRDNAAPGSEQRAALNARIDELVRDFIAWETLLRIDEPDAELAILFAQRDELIAQRAALAERQDELLVSVGAENDNVVLVSPAELPTEPAGIPPSVIAIAIAALGLALGVAIAYARSLRREKVHDRTEAAELLAAPLIVDVPRAGRGEGSDRLPILTDPEADTVEAYRFVASAVSAQQKRVLSAGQQPARVVAVASANGSPRASLTANVAIAFAQEGHRVLAVDADFKDQELTSMLLPGEAPNTGIAGIAEGNADLEKAIVPLSQVGELQLSLPEGGDLHLLARGTGSASAHYIFGQPRVAETLDRLSDHYDLVLIDSPPVNTVAYAEPVIELADGVLATVTEGEAVSDIAELGDRLKMSPVPVVGYVYLR